MVAVAIRQFGGEFPALWCYALRTKAPSSISTPMANLPVSTAASARIFRLRAAALAVVWLVAGHVALAQTDPGAVTENSRDGRQVMLTLRSGPHPLPGDYPVTVYLPPNYDTETTAYRVLFAFDAYASDMVAEHDALVQANLIYPAILVSIANKTSTSRNYDLTPTVSGALTGGLESFTDLIVHQLKPYLDAHFRTRPEAASTGVVGVSYGGLAACWLGYFHSETFGLAGCLEPSLWWNGNELLNHLQSDTTPKFATRFWIMAADQGLDYMWQNAKFGAYALTQRGWREGEDVAFCQVHNYGHGWAGADTQVRSMLHFLLRKAPAELVSTELTNCHGPQLVPLRPADLGGVANAYLDLHFSHDLRTTAIAPVLQVANPQVAWLTVPLLGQLIPVGPGWTTVSADYGGFRAVIDVQGNLVGTDLQPPTRPGPPVVAEHPASQTEAPGGSVVLGVAATGTAPFSYQWRLNGQPISGAIGATLTFAGLAAADAGDYDVVVSNALGGSTLSRTARLVVATPDPGRLVSLSVRSVSRSRGTPLIVGVSVVGGSRTLLLRGIGPTLAQFGVTDPLLDPLLEVHVTVNGRDTIAVSNDNWGTGDVAALRSAFAATGAFALPDTAARDAALLYPVEGLRSIFVYDTANRSGVTLAEVYDTGAGSSARLASISARNFVDTGDNLLIAGFSISGNAPKRLLIRGVGPALTGYNVSGALADPLLEVYEMRSDGSSVLFARNDNWGDEDVASLRAAFTAIYAFVLPDAASKDAALLLTLPAGTFTAQISGVGNTTGEALVEVYDLDP